VVYTVAGNFVTLPFNLFDQARIPFGNPAEDEEGSESYFDLGFRMSDEALQYFKEAISIALDAALVVSPNLRIEYVRKA